MATLSSPRFAYVSLGSNLGDRERYLATAQAKMNAHPWLSITRRSRLYETKPQGVIEQDDFLNMVVEVLTCLSPLELLRTMLAIETELGRRRTVRWGPRTIDLDLLLYEGEAWDDDELTLPHPRMWERAFVIVPLRDIWRAERFGPPPELTPALLEQGVELWRPREGGVT